MVDEFKASLGDLTSNSKPMIRFLTMLADDYIDNAPEIVCAIESRIMTVSDKLPVLYLIDSVVKSMNNSVYSKLFANNIVNIFQAIFNKADEKLKQDLFKLRKTWIDAFPETVLQKIDQRINSIDNDWPVLNQDSVQDKLAKAIKELEEANETIKQLREELMEKTTKEVKRRVLLPTPDMPTDPRYAQLLKKDNVNEDVVIDQVSHRVPIGSHRFVNIGSNRDVRVECDRDGRVIIDGEHCYQIGDIIRDVCIRGKHCKIFFHGEFCPLWIDKVLVDTRADAPPMEFVLPNSLKYEIRVDGPSKQIYIDGVVVGLWGSPPSYVQLRDGVHQLRSKESPKMVIIDGKHHTVVFDEDIPFVFVDDKARTVAFNDGTRDCIIDSKRYSVQFNKPSHITIDGVVRSVAFGGPCHELMIDKMMYEIGFGDPPRTIIIYGFPHEVGISGPLPQVKLGREIVKYTKRFKDGKYTDGPSGSRTMSDQLPGHVPSQMSGQSNKPPRFSKRM